MDKLKSTPLVLANSQQNTSAVMQSRAGSFEALQMDVTVVNNSSYLNTEDAEQEITLLNGNNKQISHCRCDSEQPKSRGAQVWYNIKEHPLVVAILAGLSSYILGVGTTSYFMCSNNHANDNAVTSSLSRVDAPTMHLDNSESLTKHSTQGHPQSIAVTQTTTGSTFKARYEFSGWSNIDINHKFSLYSDQLVEIMHKLNDMRIGNEIHEGLKEPFQVLADEVRFIDEYTRVTNYDYTSHESRLKQEVLNELFEMEALIAGKEIRSFWYNYKPDDQTKKSHMEFKSLLDSTNQQMLEDISFLTPEKFLEFDRGSELSWDFKSKGKKIFSDYFASNSDLFDRIEKTETGLVSGSYIVLEKMGSMYRSMITNILKDIIKDSKLEIINNSYKEDTDRSDVNSIAQIRVQNELLPLFDTLCKLEHSNHSLQFYNVLYDKKVLLIKALQKLSVGSENDNRHREADISDTNSYLYRLKKPLVTDGHLINCITESMQLNQNAFLEAPNKTITSFVNDIIEKVSVFYYKRTEKTPAEKWMEQYEKRLGEEAIANNETIIAPTPDPNVTTTTTISPDSLFNINYALDTAVEKVDNLAKRNSKFCKDDSAQEQTLLARYGGTSHKIVKKDIQSTLEKELNEKINHMVDDLHDAVFSTERILKAKPVTST